MDKWEAQYAFWSGFGVPAYEANSVPDRNKVSFPYITYEPANSSFNDTSYLSASIWTRSSSWEQADVLSDSILDALKNGGKYVACDGGALWFCPGSPFSQSMGDEHDDKIRRKILSITLQFV